MSVAYELTDAEAAVMNSIRYVAQTNGYGEVRMHIKAGEIVMANLTLDVKIPRAK